MNMSKYSSLSRHINPTFVFLINFFQFFWAILFFSVDLDYLALVGKMGKDVTYKI